MLTNLQLFTIINSWSHHFFWLDELGIFFADYVAYAIALIALIVLFYPRHKRALHRKMAIIAVFSGVCARYVIKSIIVLFHPAARPFIALTDVRSLVHVPPGEYMQSFPSGHALFFFAFSMSIYFFNKKLGVCLLILSLVMGIARVFAGVHWPLDIVWGALIGIAVSLLIHAIYLKYKTRIDSISRIFSRKD